MRFGHSAILVDSTMWIFGGYTGAGMPDNDVFSYSLTSHSWSCVDTSGQIPPRYFHSACHSNGFMYVFGGISVNGRDAVDSRLWSLNLTTYQWSVVNLSGQLPPPRWGCSCAFDHPTQTMFVYGGTPQSIKEKTSRDLWAFEIQERCCSKITPGFHSPLIFNTHTYGAACVLRGVMFVVGGQVSINGKEPLCCNLLAAGNELSSKNSPLNDDMLYYIFTFLSNVEDLISCSMVSHQWYHICCLNDSLWVPFAPSLGSNFFGHVSPLTARSKVLGLRCLPVGLSQTLKITFIGDNCVGKTSIIYSSTMESYDLNHYIPGMPSDYATKVITIRETPYLLNLWDTSSMEEFNRLRPLGYPGTVIFVIVFAVNDRDSLAHIEKKWIPEAREECPDAKRFVVANKIDLRETPNETLISYAEGATFAQKHDAVYVEVSALRRVGLKELMECIAYYVLYNTTKPSTSTKPKSGKCSIS